MRTPNILRVLALSFPLAGCAGYRGGWESVPYVGDALPQRAPSPSPYDSRERARLRFDALTVVATIDNQVRTYDTKIIAFVVPVSVDRRLVPTVKPQPRRTRVTLQLSGMTADFELQPALARFTVGDSTVRGIAGSVFGMWDAAGQRVANGGEWGDKATGERFALTERNRTYILNIDFPISSPSPELRTITLDLSQALRAPGVPALPVIKFTPAKWKHGYT